MNIENELELKYRDQFRSHFREAFQNWFERLMLVIHGDDCFLPIRVTRGDGGLDGLVLKRGHVYQLFAPVALASDSDTAAKIKTDFAKAMDTMKGSLAAWSFVHNSPDGKVGHLTAQTLAQLVSANSTVKIAAQGIDGLWEEVLKAPIQKLCEFFEVSNHEETILSQLRSMMRLAQDQANRAEGKEAFQTLKKGLALAEHHKLVDLQAEFLIALSLRSSPQSGMGDRAHYFTRLEALRDKISDPQIIVMFYRAQGAFFESERRSTEAMAAYRKAIELASSGAPGTSVLTQLCVIRAELVHLLCNQNLTAEAECELVEAEAYAKENPQLEDGKVLLEALGAGLHWAAKVGDEEAVIARIKFLEASATTGYQALGIAGELVNAANHLSGLSCHIAAKQAAEACLRLVPRIPADVRDDFLPGALYTRAVIELHAGHPEKALAGAKALMNTTQHPDLKFAITQLISASSRQLGDTETALNTATIGLGLSSQAELSVVAKMNMTEALVDTGRVEEALQLAKEVWTLIRSLSDVPVKEQFRILGCIADLASQLGDDAEVTSIMARIALLAEQDNGIEDERTRLEQKVHANTEMRRRIEFIAKEGQNTLESLRRVGDFAVCAGADEENVHIHSLQEANALTISPLIKWWEDAWEDTKDGHGVAALDYDYWGRGGFAQILNILQAYPHTFNVTVEVRTLQDIEQALRLWTLYADFLLLLWKGPTVSGRFLHLVDGEYYGRWGAGYIVALGSEFRHPRSKRVRHAAIGYASWLPPEITRFLVTQAKPFLASGRVLLVPATGVGCMNAGHGVMEQLLTETANSIPALKHSGDEGIYAAALPYAVNIPFSILYDYINDTEIELLEMRRALMQQIEFVARNGIGGSRVFEQQIADAVRSLRVRNEKLARRRRLRVGQERTEIGLSPVFPDGSAVFQINDYHFSPLLKLETLGYGWKIGRNSVEGEAPYRFAPQADEPIGAWLAPPEPGAVFAGIKTAES